MNTIRKPVNATLEKLFKEKVVYIPDKNCVPTEEKTRLHSGIKAREGFFLYDLIRENKKSDSKVGIRRVLEIGMANGISSLHICQALKDNEKELNSSKSSNSKLNSKEESYLVSIDPNQKSQWKNSGKCHIKNAGLKKYSVVVEKKSYDALPALLYLVNNGDIEKFDMIFIDGMHLFDYTLVDFFYSDLLLRKGGVIVVDDIAHSGSKYFYQYAIKNYKHYKVLNEKNSKSLKNFVYPFDKSLGPVSKTMATFYKTGEDEREWYFHQEF